MATTSLLPPRQAWRAGLRDLAIDAELGQVVVGGDRRRLSPQQQAILEALLVQSWVSVDRLMDLLWGVWLEPPDHPLGVIRVQVCFLRRKLEGSGAAIINLPGRGYRLECFANDNAPAASQANDAAEAAAAL